MDTHKSDYINAGYSDWESYEILREANAKLFNSLPLDFVALINLPMLDDQWYQEKTKDKNKKKKNRFPLSPLEIFKFNYKKLFSAMEVLDGQGLFESIGLNIIENPDATGNDSKKKYVREPQYLKKLFNNLQSQQKDRQFGFNYLFDPEVP